MRNHNTFFFLVVFHVSLLVGRHLCSSDNYQVRFLFILKKKTYHIQLDRLTAEGKPDGEISDYPPAEERSCRTSWDVALTVICKRPTPKEKKNTNNGVRVNFCVCDPLVWDTHMRPLKHNSSFGKEAKVEKEPVEREERRNTLILLREWEGEGRGAAHVPERRPFTGAGGERRKDWLSGLWAVFPAAGWLLAIQS